MAEVADRSIIAPLAVGDGVLYIEGTSLSRFAPSDSSDISEDEEVAGIVPDLSQVTATLSGFAEQIMDSLKRARPGKLTFEFGCDLAIESGGGFTLLIGKGSVKTNLKVTMEWEASSP